MGVRLCTGGEADAPALLRDALAGYETVVWLAADRDVTGSLDPLITRLESAPVVLVPFQGEPTDPDGELTVLAGGVYDGGVLAVRRGAEPFLDWWSERLAAEPGLVAPAHWLNLVPGYFDCTILREPLPVSPPVRKPVAQPPAPAAGAEPPAPAPSPPPVELAPGVNLVLRASDEPLAELASEIEACLVRLGIRCARTELVHAGGGSRLAGADPRATPFDTDLVCLNPLDLAAFAFHVDAGFFSLRRAIGVWLLEETPAPDLDGVAGYCDELWTASTDAARALTARTGKPAHRVPVPVQAASPAGRSDGFTVVTVAALGGPFAPGAAERANPAGALRAYLRAFGPGDGATLLVRTTNGAEDVPALEELKLETDRPDVTVADGPLPAGERRSLVAGAGCYLSLARSTELDLPALEALAAGTPVVATGAGLDVDGFLRIRSAAATIPETFRTAFSGEEWLEPDLDDAARLLSGARAGPARGSDEIRRLHSTEQLEAFLADRLASLLPARTSRARRALARLLG